jgi:hypothetical protein
MAVPIEYIGFDDLHFSTLDEEGVKSQIARAAEKLRADGKLRVHVTKHQHGDAKPKYGVHLFFEHNGHKHTIDKHHGWDLQAVVKESFQALETQVAREHR